MDPIVPASGRDVCGRYGDRSARTPGNSLWTLSIDNFVTQVISLGRSSQPPKAQRAQARVPNPTVASTPIGERFGIAHALVQGSRSCEVAEEHGEMSDAELDSGRWRFGREQIQEVGKRGDHRAEHLIGIPTAALDENRCRRRRGRSHSNLGAPVVGDEANRVVGEFAHCP